MCHLVDGYNASSSANAVDGDPVPVPHFGLAMTAEAFHALAERVRKNGVKFELEPHVRFSGAPGEQWTMFFRDPSGNALEFKARPLPFSLGRTYAGLSPGPDGSSPIGLVVFSASARAGDDNAREPVRPVHGEERVNRRASFFEWACLFPQTCWAGGVGAAWRACGWRIARLCHF